MHKVFVAPLLFLLLLSACTIGQVSRPVRAPGVSEPAIAVPGQAGGTAGGEKVVEMVTQTVTPGQATKPTAEMPNKVGTPAPSDPPASGSSSASFTWPTAIALSGVQMTSYTDTLAGFSFQYPGFWNITDLSNVIKQNASAYTISLRSPSPTPGPKQQDGIMPGVAAIDITVLRNDGKTLAQAADERRQAALNTPNGQPLKTLIDQPVTMPSGLAAQYFVFQDTDGSTSSQLVTLVHGHTLLVSGFGDQTFFTTVTGSIQEGK